MEQSDAKANRNINFHLNVIPLTFYYFIESLSYNPCTNHLIPPALGRTHDGTIGSSDTIKKELLRNKILARI